MNTFSKLLLATLLFGTSAVKHEPVYKGIIEVWCEDCARFTFKGEFINHDNFMETFDFECDNTNEPISFLTEKVAHVYVNDKKLWSNPMTKIPGKSRR